MNFHKMSKENKQTNNVQVFDIELNILKEYKV